MQDPLQSSGGDKEDSDDAASLSGFNDGISKSMHSLQVDVNRPLPQDVHSP